MTARTFAWLGGAVLGLAWGVLPALGTPPFSTHMAQHMLVVAVAAPLLALAVAGTRWDPVPRAPRVCSAVLASSVELVLVWGWHAPGLHHAARHLLWARALEQGSFLVAGGWLWISVVGGSWRQRRQRAVAGLAGLLLTSMHMTLLGAVLMLAPRVLYPHPGTEALPGGSLVGLSAEHDQQIGGALMIVLGAGAYLVGGLAVAAGLVRRRIGAEP